MRAPIWFYRAGVGFLFGSRLLMLEHVGRSSGATRYAVLEVVSRPTKSSVVIASAVGRKAQWFQNLVAEPQCRVSIGWRRHAEARATVLSPEDAVHFLADYQSQHPEVWERLKSLMTDLHGGDPNFELPLVRLELSPPPEQRSDRQVRT